MMGMYTECRGFLKIKIDISDADIEKEKNRIKRIINFFDETTRADQVKSSTVVNIGFNWDAYVFIGGSIKNYERTWEKYIEYLKSELTIYNGFIETQYEEDYEYSTLYLKGDE